MFKAHCIPVTVGKARGVGPNLTDEFYKYVRKPVDAYGDPEGAGKGAMPRLG